MLKITKSHFDGSYIVYEEGDFDNHHTHTKYREIALVIRDNVSHLRLPKSTDKKMIESHIRVSTNSNYIDQLYGLLVKIDEYKHNKHRILER